MSNIIEGITKDLKAIPKNLKAKAGGMDTKKLVLLNLPYIFVGYICDKVAWLWRVSEGTNASDKMMAVMNRFDKLFANPLPSFHPRDLLIGVAGGIALRLVVYYKAKNAKKFRQGVEYGSARWGNAKDIEPYMDSVFENNVLLTQTERLMMSGRPKEPKYARNKNILVIGGSGSGKTRFFVKPNLMQMHSSYVVTDPKGTVLVECGKMLKRGKYKIKVLNTINFAKSMHYNPFAYIRSEKDILKLVNTIIVNTKGEGQQSGEDFWVKAEKLYYTALIAYIWYEAPEEEQNFAMLIDMIDASEAREDDENFKNAVDLLFEELEAEKPDHFAVRQYKKYKLAAGVVCFKRLLNQAVGKSLRTHNLKPKKGAQAMRKNEKITALYERLSRDDFGKDDDQQRESNSISNQKAMLEEFAARQGFTNIVHFTDDGISGTCFDRPGFLAMMKEVEAGNVEYLCIKDMSRMGRDYLKVGQIMEILRQRGVRLIAINDGVDSARGDDFLRIPMKLSLTSRPLTLCRKSVGMSDATRTAGAKQLPSRAYSIAPIAAARCMSTAPTTASAFLNTPAHSIPKFLAERSARPSTVSMKMWYCPLFPKCSKPLPSMRSMTEPSLSVWCRKRSPASRPQRSGNSGHALPQQSREFPSWKFCSAKSMRTTF